MSTLPEKVVKDVEDMLSKFDKNNDRELDWDEVYQRLESNGSKDPFFATLSMFNALDKDNNDKISLSEIQAHKMDVYAKKCEKIIKNDINKLLKEYDTNKDKRVTFDEVLAVFEKDPEIDNPRTNAGYLFRAIDKDNDKVITVEEIRSYSKRFNNLYPSQ